ncbi:Transcriptional regulator, Cro/CI family [Microbacterium esteraromaticum]|uniref:Transcriptional regulator, Cro/CI family n=1 Tax=Microbacterium esteraromaticum TaxID=57043 RepID=A0A1R4J2U9_9MICO|nr:helix-turn-helix transcriptional regulator [Microbacterium esteraromaticum]SJN26075.1 Transcriptional regulator, Cro/CI family [Microbacterium esteraromaticum]
MPIVIDIDVMLARRKMSVQEFADAIGITPANVAVLKNGRAKAVRFTTLDAICRVLDCQPGDILRRVPEDEG